ncbi:hypothetical protein [Paucibacter soli]|uniref:hypothetical protein n=1 Tax=Paucibacter soli TaxID=3133433 RepID=UPI0030B19AA3
MATKTEPRKKPAGDTTRTARAATHLERLREAKGKRLLVDLDAPGREALEILLKTGYGASQKEVVINALLDAASKVKKVA